MARPVSNVEVTTDTFQSWLNKTNELADLVTTEVVTANSTLGETTGNAHVYGTFGADVMVATDGLRGGNPSVSNTLTITSNTNINGGLTVTGHGSFSNGVTTDWIDTGDVEINSTSISIGGFVVNSSSSFENANNASHLQDATWESPGALGSTTSNTANVSTLTVDKIEANGSLGMDGYILHVDGTGTVYWDEGGGTGDGYTGSRGYTGSQGIQGPTGYTGSKGADGAQGPQGYTGSQGPAGVGTTGYTGSRGATGYTGSGASIGTSDAIRVGSLGVGTTAGTTGTIRATGEITGFYSDDRLKVRLGSIENALDKVLSLTGFYFRPNQTAKDLGYEDVLNVGVSAQEVKRVLPEVVVPAPIDETYMTVHYDRIVPLLIEAVKELKEMIDAISK